MALRREPRPMELFVETHMRNDYHQKGVQWLVDSWTTKFMVSWISIIFLLIFLKLACWLLFFRKYKSLNFRRDTRTILQSIQNSIWICGWRQDHPVDPIEIKFTRIYGRVIVYQLLDARYKFWALNFQSSRRF